MFRNTVQVIAVEMDDPALSKVSQYEIGGKSEHSVMYRFFWSANEQYELES